jgi:serine protease Do
MYDPLRAKAKVVFYCTLAFLMGVGIASGLGWTRPSFAMPTIREDPQVPAQAVKPASDLSDAFVNLAGAVTPAVVRIESRRPPDSQQDVPDAFRRYFGMPDQNQPPSQGELAGGSGFIISPDGYVLTNNHVVEDADQVRVYLPNRRYYDAKVVGADPFTDIAVLKIDADHPLPTLSFGNSDDVRVGEWILAIGNPGFGNSTQLDYTVTAGIVSARGRGLQLLQNDLLQNPRYGQNAAQYAIEDFIQTDAVINPGNSGGPMVNLQGQVVGINSAIASTTGYYQGYGFAIPINLARRVMQDLIRYGHVKRPMIGVQITDVHAEDADVYGLPSVSGVLVQDVTKDGPAEGVLKRQDVIVKLDGKPVGYVAELQAKVAEHHPGDEVTLTVYRDKHPMQVTIRLTEAPISDVQTEPSSPAVHAEQRLGIEVQSLDAETADHLGYSQAGGIVIKSVARASPAARRGVGGFIGWKLTSVDTTKVGTQEDLRSALAKVKGGEIVSLHFQSPHQDHQVVNIRMPK